MFIFNDKLEKMIITQGHFSKESYYNLTDDEYKSIQLYIPSLPKKILDLGCGLGRNSVYLNRVYNQPDVQFILADSSIISSNIKMGWNPGEDWYNDLQLTIDFCDLNGLTNYKIIDLVNDKLDELKNIDLIYSFMSVGFHYPIEPYLEIFNKVMNKNGMMIFGVRSGMYEKSSILTKFDYVNFHNIPNNKKEKILVLKGFTDGAWK
jgi:hypothetical protein